MQIEDQRGSFQPVLIEKGVGIALENNAARGAADLEFVVRPLLHSRQEQFPDAASQQTAHRVNAAIPMIEVRHHADPRGVRCPDRE